MGDTLRDNSPRLQSHKKHLGQCRIFQIVSTRRIFLYTGHSWRSNHSLSAGVQNAPKDSPLAGCASSGSPRPFALQLRHKSSRCPTECECTKAEILPSQLASGEKSGRTECVPYQRMLFNFFLTSEGPRDLIFPRSASCSAHTVRNQRD